MGVVLSYSTISGPETRAGMLKIVSLLLLLCLLLLPALPMLPMLLLLLLLLLLLPLLRDSWTLFFFFVDPNTGEI